MSQEVIEMEMAEASDYLKAVAASPMLAGIVTTTEVSFGLPAPDILAAAETHGSDLIVLCSHGRTGFTRWALGSVAHTLAHQSTVPLLVLRQNEALSFLSHADMAHPLRTLVPLDGSKLAEVALNPAASLTAALAAPARGALHLAEVVKDVPAATEEGVVSVLNEEAFQQASTYLAAVAERLQTTMKGLRLTLTYAVGYDADVASTLVSMAEHGDEGKEAEGVVGCDLIAISTHGRSGLQRWVMGSVTERILTATKLPILIVRPEKKR
jgi:nucleotide-binding universal stress UspA family protein